LCVFVVKVVCVCCESCLMVASVMLVDIWN